MEDIIRLIWDSIVDGFNYFVGGIIGGFAGFFISNDFTSPLSLGILVFLAIGLAISSNGIQRIKETNEETTDEKLNKVLNKVENIEKKVKKDD